MNKILIIITGHSGSGKSTLAGQLSQKYRIPYLSKDALKERIFDGLGSGDKDWSRKVSGVSHRIMDDIVAGELQAGRSIIVESNFKPDIDSPRFRELARKYQATCLQILCKADGAILFERWNNRIKNGLRHEGHVEEISLEQIRQDLSVPYQPLDLPEKLIEIDTSDTAKIELPTLESA